MNKRAVKAAKRRLHMAYLRCETVETVKGDPHGDARAIYWALREAREAIAFLERAQP